MINNSFKEIYEKLKSSKKVILSLHRIPDGDSLSSCVSMKYFLERDFGCHVKLVSKDSFDEVFSDLKFSSEVDFGYDINKIDFSEFDLFVSLDSGSLEMMNFDESNRDKIFIVNMDHHRTNPCFGDLNYVDSKRNSCSAVLIDFFKSMEINFDSELSTRLLLGVCTDSGFFTNPNSEDALKDASFLIENGANYFDFILKNIVYKESFKIKKYFAYIINNLVFNKEKRFCYFLMSHDKMKELGLNLFEVRQGISFIKNLKEIDFVFGVFDLGNGTQKISFRSNGVVDVSKFTSHFGGGGHKGAAGAEINGNLQEAKEKILRVIGNL